MRGIVVFRPGNERPCSHCVLSAFPDLICSRAIMLRRVYSGAKRTGAMAGTHVPKQLLWICRHKERSLRSESVKITNSPLYLLLLLLLLCSLQPTLETVSPFVQLRSCHYRNPSAANDTPTVFSVSHTLVTHLTHQPNCTSGG